MSWHDPERHGAADQKGCVRWRSNHAAPGKGQRVRGPRAGRQDEQESTGHLRAGKTLSCSDDRHVFTRVPKPQSVQPQA